MPLNVSLLSEFLRVLGVLGPRIGVPGISLLVNAAASLLDAGADGYERLKALTATMKERADQGVHSSPEEILADIDRINSLDQQIQDAGKQSGRARVGMLALVAVLFTGLALAAVHGASWTKATTNVDGSAIPTTGEGSVTTTVEYGTCSGTAFGTKQGDVIVATSGTSASTPNLPPGTWCFRAKHTNTFGRDSDWTPAVQLVEAAPKPNPPVGLTLAP